MTNGTPILVDHRGQPIKASKNGHVRPDLAAAFVHTNGRRAIRASYDVARTTDDNANHWAFADSLDADSADSPAVRGRIVSRSRYEAGSNGYMDGILQTHANYVVGLGPTLRMQTPSKDFNQQVENAWWSWWKVVLGRRKLWCMCHAKVQDGETFAAIRQNKKIPHPVKLDFVPFETEQCASPYLRPGEPGRVDGIRFDEWGNPTFYEVLKHHPGGEFASMQPEPELVPASYMVHWFTLRRPGQHRAVPEFKSTLSVGASSRRWREATVAAAETAADYAALLKTNLAPEGVADLAAPFTTVPLEKRAMAALPMGWDALQMKAEHPNATYETFHRAQINETSRPKSIPQNIAMCDSSGYNFASGKLDHGTYFLVCDIEREDANDLAMDKIFPRWFEFATLVYGWAAEPEDVPPHSWDWPKHPVGDVQAQASAYDTRLKNGSLSLSKLCSEMGEDFNDQIEVMAQDYGVSVDEMRKILLTTNLAGAAQQAQAQMQQAQPGNQQTPGGPGQ